MSDRGRRPPRQTWWKASRGGQTWDRARHKASADSQRSSCDLSHSQCARLALWGTELHSLSVVAFPYGFSHSGNSCNWIPIARFQERLRRDGAEQSQTGALGEAMKGKTDASPRRSPQRPACWRAPKCSSS